MTKLNDKSKQYIKIFAFILFFISVRYLCYGFTYFYQLDDYIQYWAYPRIENTWENVILNQGLLCSRPLAGLSDVYIWGSFFDNMIVAVLIISVLYALSAILFLDVFKKYFKTGVMFTVFYALMPFFYEGAYWVSASSRIVAGLFFTALSAWLLQKLLVSDKKRYILPFFIVQLISVCFYEQIFILSMVLNFGMIILNSIKKEDRKKSLYILILVANAIIYFVITKIFANADSALGNRISIELPRWNELYFSHIKSVLGQLKSVFWDVPNAITFKGFLRGLRLIFDDKLWIMIPVICILAVSAYRLCKNEEAYDSVNTHKKLTVFVGAVLAAMPVLLFFIISNPYICMRNILPSFVGIALISDMVFGFFARHKKIFMSVVSAALSVLFFVSAISETRDYKSVYDFDMKIAENVKQVINTDTTEGTFAFIIPAAGKGMVNMRYHEHDSGVISSDWALCGLLNYINPPGNNAKAYPIEVESDNIYHSAWNAEQRLLTNFSKLYCWRNDTATFVEVKLNILNDSIYELVTNDGVCVAITKEHYGTGYILFN